MKREQKIFINALALFIVVASLAGTALAQEVAVVDAAPDQVLEGAALTRVVPVSFYFEGQAAPTQMRNAAAARVNDHHVIAGMVDTSGYSADVRAHYQGFFITDGAIKINGKSLPIGAYGFGFTNDGKFNILDIGNHEVLSVSSTSDKDLKRPRPLMMTMNGKNVRLYAGRDYVVIAVK